MIRNNRYFPTSRQERAAWCGNFGMQFADVAVSLGFTAGEATANSADCALVVSLASIAVQLDAYAAAVRQFGSIITEGAVGDKTPAFPDFPSYSSPAGPATGVFERIDALVKRIRVAPNYTNEIGALLGIIPSSNPGIPVDEMQPTLKTTSLPGSVVQVKFVRGETNGIFLETRIDNSETWSSVGIFPASPAVVVIPQNAQNLPRSVQLRARFVEGNSPVGQFSDIVTTATQPAI
jgi:hypothetical protein